MPLRPDPEDAAAHLLTGADGAPLARLELRDDDGEQVAAAVVPLSGDLAGVVAQARRDLAGLRLDTGRDDLVAALVASGLVLRRAATTLTHDLVDLPAPAPLPPGWSWRGPGWDDDLAQALAAAYGPRNSDGSGHPDGAEHPDGRWQPEDTQAVRDILEHDRPVPPLAAACGRVVDPGGRSTGHVLTAGPVPWTARPCGWVLNLAVAPGAQRQGLGRALLDRALHGTRQAGLPTLDLSVVDGGPGRRLYDAAGLRVLERVLSVDLPRWDAGRAARQP